MKRTARILTLLVVLSACGRREAAAPSPPAHCDPARMHKPAPGEVRELVEAALQSGGELRTLDEKSVASRLGTCVFALNYEIVRARDAEPSAADRRRFVSSSPAALFMRRALLSGRKEAYAAAKMDCYVYLLGQLAADRRSCLAFLDPKASPADLNDAALVSSAKSLAPVMPPMPAGWHASPETGAADDGR